MRKIQSRFLKPVNTDQPGRDRDSGVDTLPEARSEHFIGAFHLSLLRFLLNSSCFPPFPSSPLICRGGNGFTACYISQIHCLGTSWGKAACLCNLFLYWLSGLQRVASKRARNTSPGSNRANDSGLGTELGFSPGSGCVSSGDDRVKAAMLLHQDQKQLSRWKFVLLTNLQNQ